jgi:hypothetical protein
MKNAVMTILAITLAVAVLGCSQAPNSGTEAANAGREVHHDDHEGHNHTASSTATPSADKVEIADAGSKFDPAVDAERIPDEAWACVMGGKVHYASMQKGDGVCPVCGMKLNQHAAHSEQ